MYTGWMCITVLAFLHVEGVYPPQQPQNEVQQSCETYISHEEHQKDIDALRNELSYWQNATIEILKKHVFGGEGVQGNGMVQNDSIIKVKLDELDEKLERNYNAMQGMANQLSTLKASLESNINTTQREISQLSHPPLGSFLNPAPSCKFIQEGSPSGHYWIQHTATGYANLEYCHMTRRCCNSTGGWMRVAHLNMTDENQRCPSGFRLITSPKRTCGTPGSRCVSTTFPLNGVKYSRVCGKIIAYQYGVPEGFGPYYHNHYTIDGSYVDGVSLTHGKRPRKHIWTFANAINEGNTGRYGCPCLNPVRSYTGVVPPFVGQDYFCDTGSENSARRGQFYRMDPLWDGSGCAPASSCCTFNNPPWFCKELPQPTSDDIEMRVCLNGPNSDEDVALQSVDIYVQ